MCIKETRKFEQVIGRIRWMWSWKLTGAALALTVLRGAVGGSHKSVVRALLLMRRCESALPKRIFPLRYEQLVSVPALVTKALYRFCGLDWVDGAEDPTANDKPVATASAVQTLTDKLAGLGGSFSKIAALSIASVDNLAALFGGIDNLNASVDAYYRNFYSDAERSARTAQQLAAEFGKLGLATPGTLAQFRALVDAHQRELAFERERGQPPPMLKAIADASADAIFAKDPQGRYLLCNRAASEFIGKPVDEVLGRDEILGTGPFGEIDSELAEPASTRPATAEEPHASPGSPRSRRPPNVNAGSGITSATSNTCRPAARSCCSTGPGTTGPGWRW